MSGITTFKDYLARQTPEFEDEVPGKDRAEFFRSSKLTLQQLVDESGRELTLAELRARNSESS